MQRKDIKENDKWDLTKYFKNDSEYQKKYEETKKILEQLVSKKGHIYDDLYSFLELDNKLS